MTAANLSSMNELLNDLKATVEEQRIRWRLHCNPDGAMWIVMSVAKTLGDHVTVVPDPQVPVGYGWVETITGERWRHLQALVGQRVRMGTAELGVITGTLLRLEDKEARIDLGGGDIRYPRWISVEVAS